MPPQKNENEPLRRVDSESDISTVGDDSVNYRNYRVRKSSLMR